jgi:hypothetical protein
MWLTSLTAPVSALVVMAAYLDAGAVVQQADGAAGEASVGDQGAHFLPNLLHARAALGAFVADHDHVAYALVDAESVEGWHGQSLIV